VAWGIANDASADCYEYHVRSMLASGPVVAVVENVQLTRVLEINGVLGVPTILCPQNLDSLAFAASLGHPRLRSVGRDFRREVQSIIACEQRLLISTTECSIVGGLGVRCSHYPYRPVGHVKEYFEQLRRRRKDVRPGRFLLVGTADWGPTRDSIQWFLDEVLRPGIPFGTTVTVVGAGTERLMSVGNPIRGVNCMGRLDDGEFAEQLARAEAILVPHVCGFGALTRLADLTCAGIPIIASRQATYGLAIPPGVRTVDNSANCWHSAMKEVRDQSFGAQDYEEWYRGVEPTLRNALRNIGTVSGS